MMTHIHIQPWGLRGKYIVVNDHGLLLAHNRRWTMRLTSQTLYHSYQEASSTLAEYLKEQ